MSTPVPPPRFGTATLGVPPPALPPVPAEPPADPPRRGRRATLLAGAAVLLLLAAYLVGSAVGGRGRTSVWQLDRDVAAGAALGPADLVEVQVSSQAARDAVPARPLAARSTAAQDLRRGQLLLREDVGSDVPLPAPGQSLVGVGVAPGAAPDGLRAGADVAVLRLPVTSSSSGQPVDLERPADVLLERVTVVAVSPSGTGTVVTLLAPDTALGPLAALGAQGRLALVALPG